MLRRTLLLLWLILPGTLAAAADLGSDVPVCVRGIPVFMRGRGEVLDPVELRGPLEIGRAHV